MIAWFEKWDAAIYTSLGVSVVMFVAALVAVRAVIIRLPANYFAPSRRRVHVRDRTHPAVYAAWLVGKNLLGVTIALVGLVFLFTPGQGVLTFLIGLMLTDVPGKYRLERWIVRQPPVLHAINAVRRRAGSPPLVFDEPPHAASRRSFRSSRLRHTESPPRQA